MGAKRTSSTVVPTSRPISIRRGRFSGGSFISATVAVAPKGTEVSGCRAGEMLIGSPLWQHRFDKDGFGQCAAQGDPRIADQADDVGLAAEQFDLLFLAQAQLAQ